MHTINIPEMKLMITHVAVNEREPLMFWGQPGAGKSEGVAQSAEEHDALLCDIRLSQYASVDLRGLPDRAKIEGSDKSLTVWDLPATLPFKGNPNFPTDRLIFLFLDEINSAVPAVSAVAYQLVNDRRVGEHELLDNVRIIAAGNRETDGGVTNKQPLPLSNRFTHAEIGIDVDAWCQWAQSKKLPAIGVAFLQFRKPLISTFDPRKPDKAFATGRTWAKALRYYASTTMPEAIKMAAISGAVGVGPAAEFWGFADVWQSMTPIAQIIADPQGVPLPEEAAMRYALAVNISGNFEAANLAPLYQFMKRLDPEFMVLAWKLAMQRDAEVVNTPEFLLYSKEYMKVFQ